VLFIVMLIWWPYVWLNYHIICCEFTNFECMSLLLFISMCWYLWCDAIKKLWLYVVVYNYFLFNLTCCECRYFYPRISIYLPDNRYGKNLYLLMGMSMGDGYDLRWWVRVSFVIYLCILPFISSPLDVTFFTLF
jgi:hypothetical protein